MPFLFFVNCERTVLFSVKRDLDPPFTTLLFVQRHMYPSFTRVVSVSSILEPHREHCWQLAKSLWLTKKLRVTCCNGQLYLCKIEKNRFSENLSGRRFLLTCFKTVTLRLFGFLFSSPDSLLYFARKRAKLSPEIALFAKAVKQNIACGWKS